MARLALLEDNNLMRRYLVDLLAHVGGHEVRAFAEPTELLESLKAQAAELVILDVGLGNAKLDGEAVDGIEVSRRLKASANAPSIMLLTAHAFDGDEQSFLERSGADAYASKPIHNEDEFLMSIGRLLGE